MSKVISKACSNVALIKYWGRQDDVLRLPTNNSISLTLSDLVSTTTIVESDKDEFVLNGQPQTGESAQKVFGFVDLATQGKRSPIKIESTNSFPGGTGLSSSASGFAALAGAVNQFYGLNLNSDQLSVLARKGSGSASRSVPGGVVRWHVAKTDEASFSQTIFPADYWDLKVLAIVVSEKVKEVPTSGGHELAWTSPYFKARLEIIKDREAELLSAFESKDFEKFSLCVERECLEFHSIPMTSNPSLLYLYPATVELIHWIRAKRSQGIPVCFTINTGHNLFAITLSQFAEALSKELEALDGVKSVIVNSIGAGVEAGVV